MKDEFKDAERLLRGVLPIGDMLRKDETGKVYGITSAVFQPRRGESGVSVDRVFNRTMGQAVDYALTHLSDCIVSVSVEDCKACNARVVYEPRCENKFHSGIYKEGVDKERLSRGQSQRLSQRARLEYPEEYTFVIPR